MSASASSLWRGLILVLLVAATLLLIMWTASGAKSPAGSSPRTQRLNDPPPLNDLPPPASTSQPQPVPSVAAGPLAGATTIAEYQFRLLNELKGPIIAAGTNTVFTGTFQLLTYRVEQIDLPQTTTFETWLPGAGNTLIWDKVTVDRFWRVTVTGKEFYVGGYSWTVWVNNRLLGRGAQRVDGLAVVVFDQDLLPAGSPIAVGIETSPSQRQTLPELLTYSPHDSNNIRSTISFFP